MAERLTIESPHVRVAVIGAGLSGVAAGIALKQRGDRGLRDPGARR